MEDNIILVCKKIMDVVFREYLPKENRLELLYKLKSITDRATSR